MDLSNKTKYAISGSSGFIGSHLVRLLEERGDKVVRITQELLYSPDELKKFFEKEKPDYIIHLASYGNHSKQTDGNMTVFANLIGTVNMLASSLKIPYKGFIQVGSSSEYGQKMIPMKETDLPEPLTMYGASKVGATYLARAFAIQYGKPIVIVRPFSVYGEGEADFRFIPTAIKKLIKGEEMNLDTQAVHDWIYVEDFITGMLLACDRAENGEIINIGTGRETTNLQVIQVLENISGKKLKYKESEVHPYDTNHWSGDIRKLIGWGWKTKYPMGLGLAKVYEYVKATTK